MRNPPRRILVTGAHGLLGTALRREGVERGLQVTAPGREALDVRDGDAVRRAVEEARPDAVLHCGAFTGVDAAESREAEAMAVNGDGTLNVARSAAAVGALLVYPSTDFVFDGRARRPYPPDHPTDPRGVYARSKLAGEEAVRAAGGEWLIVRTSWLYGADGGNFVDAVLERARREGRIRVVTDQTGSPTWTGSLAPTMLDLLRAGARGVFHAADRGETSWFGLAGEALRLAGVEAAVEPVSSEAWGAPAPRPRYSVLDVSATEEALGRPLPHWTESLAAHLGTTGNTGDHS